MRLRIKDLPENTQADLEEILSTSPDALTSVQVAFLKARRSYLSAEDLTVYADVLGGKIQPKEEPKEEEVIVEKEPEEREEGEVKQINKDNYKRGTLMQMARDAGLPVENTDTKADLEEKINAYFRGE